MARTRTLLQLGGSTQQIVVIEAAKRCGYRTVVCDYLPDNPGQHYADAFYPVSTTDRDAVLEVARAENVEGVLAYSSDPAAPTAAYVAEKLGLPTNPLASVETLSVKTLFREHLRKADFPCPHAVGIPADTLPSQARNLVSSLRFPIVVKPSDSSGSKGVSVLDRSVLDTPDGLADALEKARTFTRNGMLIAEEHIGLATPTVIGGDIFVKDGRVCFWGLSNCLRTKESPLLPIGETMPLDLPDSLQSKVRSTIQDLVTSLDIRFGELNVEVIIGEGNVPYILELGARAGGAMLPVLLSDASGIDLMRANVMCAMGDDPGALDWQAESECYSIYFLNSEKSGVYRGYSLSPAAQSACYRVVPYQEEGAHVERFEHAGHMLGVLFFRFPDRAQMNAVMGSISDHVSAIVE